MCGRGGSGREETVWTIDELGVGERALVSALRGWKSCERSGGLAMARCALAEAGLPTDIVLSLASALGVLGAFCVEGRPDARCLNCAEIARDEAVLLDAIAAFQKGDEDGAARLIAPWVSSPIARGMVLSSLEDLAVALVLARCRLPGGRSGYAFEAADLMAAAE